MTDTEHLKAIAIPRKILMLGLSEPIGLSHQVPMLASRNHLPILGWIKKNPKEGLLHGPCSCETAVRHG